MSHDGSSGTSWMWRRALAVQHLPKFRDEGRNDWAASDLCHCIRGDQHLERAVSATGELFCFAGRFASSCPILLSEI